MKEVLFFGLCGLSVVVAGVLLYLGWLLYVTYELLKATRRKLRAPEVERDGLGRPLKERV